MEPGSQPKIFELLADHAVKFLVFGGHAVSYYGYIRATEDHDIIFLRTDENEARLFAALEEIKARWISDDRDPATGLERLVPVSLPYIRSSRLMMLMTDLGFLDIFDYVPGCPDRPVEELFADCAVDGRIEFVSLRWLRKLKELSGRPKDQQDLAELPEA